MVAAALWCGTPASADETPAPSPTTTTTPDAPPPDPYTPPAPSPKHKATPRKASVVRPSPAPATRTRSYTPAPSYAPARSYVRPSAPHRVVRASHTTTVRRHHKKKVHHVARAKPVHVSLAPVAQVVTAARIPLPPPRDSDRPHLWLAGMAFAFLAVAGSCLVLISQRLLRFGWE